MWILPKQLISAFAPVMGASTLDLDAASQACARSLMRRSKRSQSSSYLREWKSGNLMRLQSGLICDHSRGRAFETAWTSSLAVIPASHSQPPASDLEQTTSDTSGQLSQLAFGFCDQESVSSRTSRDTSALGYGKSSMSWEQWVTERRGEYSARLKSGRHTNASECSYWPTAKARDWKDTTGCSLDAVNPDGTHRNRRDRLVGAIAAEMSGPPAPESPNTHGNHRELSAEVQNPQWATPKASDPQHSGPNMRDSAGNYALPAQAVRETWATPQARDNRSGGAERWDDPNRSRNLNDQIATVTKQNAKLNPRWVETLMGLPVGWVMPSCASPVTIEPTNSGCSETESSQLLPQELLPF